MARTETVLSIFLASPSDVNEERNSLAAVVTQWNQTWARDQGIRLELIRWETDAFPGIGTDAQDVINQQIPNDYDLFVGIMWSRFGTPTSRASSGTLEEFERALERVNGASSDPAIFFYFKDAPIHPSKIDVEQLQQVQGFKARLADLGVLRYDFLDAEKFEELFSLHIAKFVQSKRQLHVQAKSLETLQLEPELKLKSVTDLNVAQVEVNEDEDAGYLDQLDAFQVSIEEVSEIAGRLTEAQTILTEHTDNASAQLQALSDSPNGASASQARKIISEIANKMIVFTECVRQEVPLFRAAMNASMTSLTLAATLSAEFDKEHARNAKTASITLLAALIGAKQSLENFRLNTLSLPRISKELNAAKRMQASALEDLIGEFGGSEQLLEEAIKMFDDVPS